MKRRRNGEGSYTRDKSGMYVYSSRYTDTLTGKKKRKYIRAVTQKALDAKVSEWENKLKRGITPSADMTMESFCKRFLKDVKAAVKTKTYTNYESVIRNHITPSLGEIRLNQLTLVQVQNMINHLNEKGLKAESVHTVRSILRLILNRAIAYGLIERNLAKASIGPRVEDELPAVLDKEQVNRLLEYASDSRFLPETDDECSLYLRKCYHAALQVSLDSGARQGEMRAWQWGDLRGKSIYVNRAMEGNKVGSPKTKSSYRSITLSKTTLNLLQEWRDYQERYCAKWGFWEVTDTSWIFTNGMGAPIDMQNMGKRWWRPLLKASNMPKGIKWRSLRATMATLQMAAGVPVKVVSARLGHSKVSTTLTKYCGIINGIEEQSAEVMEEIFAGADKPPTKSVVSVTDDGDKQ